MARPLRTGFTAQGVRESGLVSESSVVCKKSTFGACLDSATAAHLQLQSALPGLPCMITY
eukprot:6207970-Amphidinium_carterae.1